MCPDNATREYPPLHDVLHLLKKRIRTAAIPQIKSAAASTNPRIPRPAPWHSGSIATSGDIEALSWPSHRYIRQAPQQTADGTSAYVGAPYAFGGDCSRTVHTARRLRVLLAYAKHVCEANIGSKETAFRIHNKFIGHAPSQSRPLVDVSQHARWLREQEQGPQRDVVDKWRGDMIREGRRTELTTLCFCTTVVQNLPRQTTLVLLRNGKAPIETGQRLPRPRHFCPYIDKTLE